jgi:hypothetical protein
MTYESMQLRVAAMGRDFFKFMGREMNVLFVTALPLDSVIKNDFYFL